MDLLKRFQRNWHEKLFAPGGKTVLLAVSGGIDSMAMAHLCLNSGISFAIGHCNFGLRGEEADMDTQLIENWASENSIPFYKIYFDTKLKSEEWKKGIQETARILRYEWLSKVKSDNKYYRIATAHHANDNAETLLMNLLKGTGISGLHGIPEKTENLIRPLLFAAKDEIRKYVEDNDVPFRDDASNASDYYLRNAVRLNLLPEIEKLFPGAVENICNSITRFAEAEQLYNKAIEIERKQLIEQREADWYVPILKLQKRKPLHTICYELFKPFGFSSHQVPEIIKLLSSESGHYIDSDTHRLLHNRNFLIVTTKQAKTADIVLIEGVPAVVDTGKYSFHFSEQKKPGVIPQSSTVAYIDLKNIDFPLILRKWKTGDYFYPLGMGMKKKKLSKYFVDQKIPLHEKDHVWVLESRKRICWVAGMRLDERFKVKADTTKVLIVEMKQH